MDNNYFNDCINRLNKLYKKYPDKTEKELDKMLSKLELYDGTNSVPKILNNENFDTYAFVAIFFIIALIGLFNITVYYYFGLIFFVAGYLVSVNTDEKSTLIALFSHGMTGLGLMTIPIIYTVMNNPILTDGSTNIHIYLGLVLILFVIATLLATIYKLSKYFQSKAHFKVIPAIIYLVVIILVIMLPKIFLKL